MTKNQFLKKYGFKKFPIRYAKPYLDIVARYKGRLSYFRLSLLIRVALGFGRRGPDDILSYVAAVMDSEDPRI